MEGQYWLSMANCVETGNKSDKLRTDPSQQQYLRGFNLVGGTVGDSKWRCWFESGHCLLHEVKSYRVSSPRKRI